VRRNLVPLLLIVVLALGSWWARSTIGELESQLVHLQSLVAIQQKGTALDFGVVPTAVSTKTSASGDRVPEETIPWRGEISYPRLVALLTLAFWGTDWAHGEELTALPQEVVLPAAEHPIQDDAIRAMPWQSVWELFSRFSFTLPDGFAGAAIDIDEVLLYCPDQDSPGQLYIHRLGGSWWQYSTVVEYTDLVSYDEYYHRNPYHDPPSRSATPTN